jgi:hypothetical protein
MSGKKIPPRCSGSPVRAVLRPILATISSILRATFAIATTNSIHGIIPAADGTRLIAESSSFRNTVLKIIITQAEANIRTQPLKISSVFLLPPIANASGARITSTASTTYRSAISKKNLITWNMRMSPIIITSSHEPGIMKISSGGKPRLTAVGICSRAFM